MNCCIGIEGLPCELRTFDKEDFPKAEGRQLTEDERLRLADFCAFVVGADDLGLCYRGDNLADYARRVDTNLRNRRLERKDLLYALKAIYVVGLKAKSALEENFGGEPWECTEGEPDAKQVFTDFNERLTTDDKARGYLMERAPDVCRFFENSANQDVLDAAVLRTAGEFSAVDGLKILRYYAFVRHQIGSKEGSWLMSTTTDWKATEQFTQGRRSIIVVALCHFGSGDRDITADSAVEELLAGMGLPVARGLIYPHQKEISHFMALFSDQIICVYERDEGIAWVNPWLFEENITNESICKTGIPTPEYVGSQWQKRVDFRHVVFRARADGAHFFSTLQV
ncbi:hypothetical protein [uncultured Thiohalocapsa sp.]|uniref:hypothetical protein n=1 Tax=uncultured Thiohalocapsa sp. TaxID=768990 RepID=UPI0025EEBBFB|nr:hypothetical protein [uncultured Thiohalocapsa sp.]